MSCQLTRREIERLAFLDGREKLAELQTDFAEKCGKPFGLERELKEA